VRERHLPAARASAVDVVQLARRLRHGRDVQRPHRQVRERAELQQRPGVRSGAPLHQPSMRELQHLHQRPDVPDGISVPSIGRVRARSQLPERGQLRLWGDLHLGLLSACYLHQLGELQHGLPVRRRKVPGAHLLQRELPVPADAIVRHPRLPMSERS
jgi:hypothetical protein